MNIKCDKLTTPLGPWWNSSCQKYIVCNRCEQNSFKPVPGIYLVREQWKWDLIFVCFLTCCSSGCLPVTEPNVWNRLILSPQNVHLWLCQFLMSSVRLLVRIVNWSGEESRKVEILPSDFLSLWQHFWYVCLFIIIWPALWKHRPPAVLMDRESISTSRHRTATNAPLPSPVDLAL